MESAAELWFSDARVKTVATILQRCDNETERMDNRVHFVCFEKPLKEVFGIEPSSRESVLQRRIEKLRDTILSARFDADHDGFRMIVKEQRSLWRDGVRAGSILAGRELDDRQTNDAEDGDNADEDESEAPPRTDFEFHDGDYVAGKWGRYVRAPTFYFRILERFARRFVPLGEIATIRRGITSGCDAFFMPRDISSRLLREFTVESAFRRRAGGVPRKDVASGKIRIIQAGDGSVHPIEAEFLAPEIHSLMKVD
jgi:hypothetical protein